MWVNRVTLTVGRPLPVYLDQRTSSDRPGMSGWCQNRTHAARQKEASFTHMLGTREHAGRPKIDRKLELDRLFDRDVGCKTRAVS
jgi:hypothetical protein